MKVTKQKLDPLTVSRRWPRSPNKLSADYVTLFEMLAIASPAHIRKITLEMRLKYFGSLETPISTRDVLAEKITKQKLDPGNFQVEQFLTVFPDPISYFENNERNCKSDPDAINFLKHHFTKLKVSV